MSRRIVTAPRSGIYTLHGEPLTRRWRLLPFRVSSKWNTCELSEVSR